MCATDPRSRQAARVIVNLAAPGSLDALAELALTGIYSEAWTCLGDATNASVLHIGRLKPVSYPIPDDGPVGRLLGALGRHPYRPAHMHFIVSAPGFDTVTTHTFVAGDPYLASDAVFGVKASLIAEVDPVPDGDTKWRQQFDFVLHRKD